MSTVAQDVQQIREAVYGREVREAIADGIEHCYSDVSGGVTTANAAAAAANVAAQRANTAAAGAEGIPGTASLEDVNDLNSALEKYGFGSLGFMNVDNSMILNGFIYTDGTFHKSESDDYRASNYIRVLAGDTIGYYHLDGSSNVYVVAFYNDSKIFQSSNSLVGTGVWQDGTFTAPSNGYVRFTTDSRYISYLKFTPPSKFADRYLYGRMLIKGGDADTFGDSITEQYGVDPSETWQGQIMRQIGLSSIANHGVGASTVSDLNNGMCTDARINTLTGGALLIVMGGVNDWAQNVAIGERTYDNENTSTFFGACNVMFRKLSRKFPAVRIVAFGCTFAYYPNRDNFTDKTGLKNNQGLLSVDYSRAMMESAQLNGIEHYDIGGNLTVNKENIANYFNDGNYYIHPNVLGRYLISCFMTKSLE